jgi:thymidine kinase
VAELQLIVGSMESLKTTRLITSAHGYTNVGLRAVVIKPKIDTKGEHQVVSRVNLSRESDLVVDWAVDVREAVLRNQNRFGQIACVFADEAQFLTGTQVTQLLYLAVLDDIPVQAYALRTDASTKEFRGANRLLALAHRIELVHGRCLCGLPAHFNARKVRGEYEKDGPQVAIDQENETTYVPLCGKCYIELVGPIR